jgi:hypothetical protein
MYGGSSCKPVAIEGKTDRAPLRNDEMSEASKPLVN